MAQNPTKEAEHQNFEPLHACMQAKSFLLILEIKLIETEKYVWFEDARKIGEKSRNLSRPGKQ